MTLTLDEEVDVAISQIDSELELHEYNWEVVPDSYRTLPKAKFMNNELTRLFIEGKTIKFDDVPKLDKFYRWARSNEYKLHKKVYPGFTVVWLDRNPEKE